MNPRESVPVTIVIPDAGPLISLAKGDALDLLLIFKDEVGVVITDFVELEFTSFRTERPDAQKIADFIVKNAGRIEIEKTSMMNSESRSTSTSCAHQRRAFDSSETQ